MWWTSFLGRIYLSGDLNVQTLHVRAVEPADDTIAADTERPALHKLTFNDKCTVGGMPTLQNPKSLQRNCGSNKFSESFLVWEEQHNTVVRVKPGNHIGMQAQASPNKGRRFQTLFVFAKNGWHPTLHINCSVTSATNHSLTHGSPHMHTPALSSIGCWLGI